MYWTWRAFLISDFGTVCFDVSELLGRSSQRAFFFGRLLQLEALGYDLLCEVYLGGFRVFAGEFLLMGQSK